MAPISLPAPPYELRASDVDWPSGLPALGDAPACLRVAGTLPPLADAVAIVGTRFADAEALAFARSLGTALAAHGVPVVSGGALGVDAAAHEGALSVGGPTVAVLASGLREPYPRSHGPLFAKIARAGALLCESPDTARPKAFAFLRRNRLIAALAQAVVVVQAPCRSGALSTAAWAKQLKRPVFAVPAAPWDPRGEGCLGLLRQGATICTSAADVLSLRASSEAQLSLGGFEPGREAQAEPSNDEHLPGTGRLVLQTLGRRRRHLDELCHELDMMAPALQEALLALILAGLVRRGADGAYERALD